MTTINFTFKDLNGAPIPNTQFVIESGRLNTGEIPDVLPAKSVVTTNSEGKVSVNLTVTTAPYYVSQITGSSETFICYKFFVPFSATALDAELLYVDLNSRNPYHNDRSLNALIEAKVAVLNAHNQVMEWAAAIFGSDGPVIIGTASNISFVPSGTISSSTIQAAISELDTEKVSKAELAANGGSGLVGYLPSGTGAALTTVQTQLRNIQEWTVNIQDAPWYAKGDGVTDDAPAFQAALNAGVRTIVVPSVANCYRLASTLVCQNSVRLVGESVAPLAYAAGTRGAGSWLWFDHPGIGVAFSHPTGNPAPNDQHVKAGAYVIGIGTLRNQPTPAPGWVPGTFDYDFDVVNFDCTFDDVHLYNATNGIRHRKGNFGRLNCFNVRGFPHQVGILIENSYDLCRIENIQFWPFWSMHQAVWDWVMNNGTAVYLFRADNPFLTNIFSIFYYAGVRIGQNEFGTANKVKLVNGDFDRGRYGILIDANVVGHVGQYMNVSSQGETGITGPSVGVFVQGSGCKLSMTNIDLREHMRNAVFVQGIENYVSLAQIKVDHNDGGNVGYPAVEAYSNNTIEIIGTPKISNAGPGGNYSPTGSILVDEWRAFVATVTSETGAITTVVNSNSKYKVVGTTVNVKGIITIGANGTAGGAIRVAHPFAQGIAQPSAIGGGREVALTGKQLVSTVYADRAEFRYYDNTYPGVDNATLVYYYEYELANPLN